MSSRNTPQLWQDNLPVWDSDTDNVLVCCQIRQETHDVKSFFFKPQKSSLFQFLPGQFLTLELNIGGETINRSYTISSSPSQPHTLSLTVKRCPNGIVSNWLHDNMKVGMQINALGPAGEFTCVLHPAQKYLFLSAGSGVTPLMSMARSFHELAEDADIVFLHSARTPADIIFKQELDLIAFNQAKFKPSYLCAKVDKYPNWRLQPDAISEGMLSLENLTLIAPDFAEREIFTCGPAPYMKAVRDLLATAGYDMKHYHEESFSFETMTAEVTTEVEATSQTEFPESEKETLSFSIELTKSGTTVQCGPDQSVLEAARSAGLRLPASCSKGVCGTCKSKLISGKVDMKHGGGIRQREIDQGLFLPCCSKPLSDLVVEK